MKKSINNVNNKNLIKNELSQILNLAIRIIWKASCKQRILAHCTFPGTRYAIAFLAYLLQIRFEFQ